MANTITGRIKQICDTQHMQTKKGDTFTKREFLLDATPYDPYTGERSEYENIVPLEFSQDKCAELDRFKPGDVVTISFAIQGREWTTMDGQVKRMAGIRCYKIELRGQPQQSVTQTPASPPPSPQAGDDDQSNDLPF